MTLTARDLPGRQRRITPVSRLQISDLKAAGPLWTDWLEVKLTPQIRLILGKYSAIAAARHDTGPSGRWFVLFGAELEITAVAYFKETRRSIEPDMLPVILESASLTEDLTEYSDLVIMPATDCTEVSEHDIDPLLANLGLVCLGQMRRDTEYPEFEILVGPA